MQLLIILALLLYGGNKNAQSILSEVKPVLESIGGDEMKEALKSAEEISEVLTAVRGLAGDLNAGANSGGAAFASAPQSGGGRAENPRSANPAIGFPLAPINNIADRDIAYSLSQYFSQQA